MPDKPGTGLSVPVGEGEGEISMVADVGLVRSGSLGVAKVLAGCGPDEQLGSSVRIASSFRAERANLLLIRPPWSTAVRKLSARSPETARTLEKCENRIPRLKAEFGLFPQVADRRGPALQAGSRTMGIC
jgi:hypothetical protein